MPHLVVDDRAAALLGEIHKVRRVGVEIGVYTGMLSCRLLVDPSITLVLVDPWRAESPASYRETDDFHHRMTQAEHDAAMQKALERCKPYADRVKVCRLPSVEAAELFDDGCLDFVFIDGDHSYEGCRDDIRAWWPKLKQGGLLSGHDYRDDMNFGVKQAVHEWLGDRELRLGANYTWFVTRWA